MIERVPGVGRGRANNLAGLWLFEKKKPAEEIDRWLADRGWVDERISFRAYLKTDAPLVAQRNREIRERPCTTETLGELLALTRLASNPVDLSGVAEWCRPASAVESHDLGMLAMQYEPNVAVPLLQRALELPFTEKDRWQLTTGLSLVPLRTHEEWARVFRAQTRLALAEAYRAAGDLPRAAALRAEVSDRDRQLLARPHDVPRASSDARQRSVPPVPSAIDSPPTAQRPAE